MDQNTIQSEIGGCPKSDHANMQAFIGIYSVFRGSVHRGGRGGGGGVSIYIYICIHAYIYTSYTLYFCIMPYVHVCKAYACSCPPKLVLSLSLSLSLAQILLITKQGRDTYLRMQNQVLRGCEEQNEYSSTPSNLHPNTFMLKATRP